MQPAVAGAFTGPENGAAEAATTFRRVGCVRAHFIPGASCSGWFPAEGWS
ncbi:hypothetical protein ACJ2_44050 [Pantoea sp. QMID2]|nr:hypothetical protein ACJ2_44050 [Pantoea sp. QMID2]